MTEEIQKPAPTLSETLTKLNDKLDTLVEEKKLKKWKLPWRGRVGKRKIKRGWVSILYVGENNAAKFTKAQIDEQVVEVDGTLHRIRPSDILNYNNRPLVIIPQWSQVPFNAGEQQQKTEAAGLSTKGWTYFYNYTMKSLIKAKKNFSAGVWIFGVLIVIGIAYYMWKSGVFT